MEDPKSLIAAKAIISKLKNELYVEKQRGVELIAKNNELYEMAEGVEDTRVFLKHRERQLKALQLRCNALEGGVRDYMAHGNKSKLEAVLSPTKEEDWVAQVGDEAAIIQQERTSIDKKRAERLARCLKKTAQ